MEAGWRIAPIAEVYIAGFREALDGVARERQFLALLEAPAAEEVLQFVRNNIAQRFPQYVALAGERVVGWCDVLPKTIPTLKHVGSLGMGVVKDFRGQGIGRALLSTTVKAAQQRGIRRIELLVMADNVAAIALYESAGFVTEGIARFLICIDGRYHDTRLMALCDGLP